VIVLFVPPVTATADEVADAVVRAARGADKAVLAVIIDAAGIPASLQTGEVAAFAYPESAARALGRAVERREWLRRPAGAVPELAGVDAARGRAIVDESLRRMDDRWLEPQEARALLVAYGVPVVEERVVDSVDAAVEAATALGFPVVVKTAEAGVHKTERGGVILNLETAADVRAAAEQIGSPLLVQPMLTGSAELLAGVVQDPLFGPLVALGPGGVFAELIGDAGIRIAPLTDEDARELVLTGKTAKLVAGYRGKAAADAEAVIDAVLRLSQLGNDLPEVAELDLNPVLVGPNGCVAVDARVRVAAAAPQRRTKTW